MKGSKGSNGNTCIGAWHGEAEEGPDTKFTAPVRGVVTPIRGALEALLGVLGGGLLLGGRGGAGEE